MPRIITFGSGIAVFPDTPDCQYNLPDLHGYVDRSTKGKGLDGNGVEGPERDEAR